MKKILGIFFILLFSFCCKREINYPRLIVDDVDNVVEVNTKHMLRSTPELLGLNLLKDTTIILNKQRNHNDSTGEFGNDSIFPKYNLKIIIDTTYDFHYNGFEYKWLDIVKSIDSLRGLKYTMREIDMELIEKAYFNKINKFRKNYVQAYPLLIYNTENKDCYLNRPINGIQLIQEAKDADGIWKPIEYLANLSYCSIDNSYYVLKPKNYMATAIIKYHGNFKTKIRVKIQFGKNYYYSNEIVGFINRSQFNDDFLTLNFFKTFDFNVDEEWFDIKKEHSLLKFKF